MTRPSLVSVTSERSAGFHGPAEECLEHRFLVAVPGRMLLPNERIGSRRVKVVKILFPKRPELHEFAFQDGLEIKTHSRLLSSDFGCIISYIDSYIYLLASLPAEDTLSRRGLA